MDRFRLQSFISKQNLGPIFLKANRLPIAKRRILSF